MSRRPIFKPFPLFNSAHSQTIVATFIKFHGSPSSVTRFVHFADSERVALEISTPPNWKENDPTIVMVHGLCGSHKSAYNTRLAKKFYQRGIRTVRINLRGCGTGKGYGKRIYHPEQSDDVWKALEEIKRDMPHSPLTVMGFSLGGNIVLKMAGERGMEANGLVKKVIAVNPPIDVYSSVTLLNKNKFYERYFMRFLRADVAFRHSHFEDLPPMEIPSDMNLLEFEEFYIAPQSGFSSVNEYYFACSSGRLLPEITVQCHILFSRDDPIVDCNMLDSISVPANIDVLITEHGGHLGYLGSTMQKGGFHWMDALIFHWTMQEEI